MPAIETEDEIMARLGFAPAKPAAVDPEAEAMAKFGFAPSTDHPFQGSGFSEEEKNAPVPGVLDYAAHPIDTFFKNNPKYDEMYAGHGGRAVGFPVGVMAEVSKYFGGVEQQAIHQTAMGIGSLPGDLVDQANAVHDKPNINAGPRSRAAINEAIPSPEDRPVMGASPNEAPQKLTAAQHIMATLLQYGVPTGAAYKATLDALPMAESALGHIARGSTGLAAASATDAAVSNPDDTHTLMESKGGPTDTTGQSPLRKRASSGAENAALGGLTLPLAAGASKIVDAFSHPMGTMERIVGKHIIGRNPDGSLNLDHKDAAIGNIDQYYADKADGKYSPGHSADLGGAANTVRTVNMTRGQTSSEAKDALGELRNNNQLATARDLEQGVQKPDANTEVLRTHMVGENQKPIDDANNRLKSAESAVIANDTDAKDANATLADALALGGRGEADASKEIDKTVRKVWTDKAAERRAKMGAVDPENKIELDRDELEGLLKDITTDKYPKDEAASIVRSNPIIEHLQDRINHLKASEEEASGEAPKEPPKPITYGEVNQFWGPITNAMDANLGNGARESFKKVRQYLIDKSQELQLHEDPAIATRATEAAKANGEYTDLFRKYAGDEFVGKQKGTIGSEPTETAGVFIRPGQKGTEEAAGQLEKMLGGKDDPEVRRTILSRFIGDQTDASKVTPQQVDKFVSRYRPTLEKLAPGVKTELETLAKDLRAGNGKSAALQQELVDARRNFKETKAVQGKEPAAVFRSKNAENAVNTLMEGGDPKNAAENLRMLAENGGPDMVENLKGALGDYINRKVTTKTEHVIVPGSHDNMAAGRVIAMHDLLKGKPQLRDALVAIYGKGSDEMKALDRVHNTLKLDNIINKQTTGNSSTPELLADANRLRTLLTSTYGIIRGNAIATLTRSGMSLAHVSPDMVVSNIMARAVTDPSYAKDIMNLATTPHPARFRKFLMNNINEITDTNKDKKQDPGLSGGKNLPNAPKGGIGDDTIPTDIRLGNDNPGEDMEAKLNDAQGNSIPDKSKAAVNVDPYIRPEVLGSFTDKANMGLIKGIRSVLGKDASPQAVQAAYEKVMQHREEVKKGSLANKLATGLGAK